MDWMIYPENRPETSGTYHVSIERPINSGTFTFHAVAYYNKENDQWHKHDGFDDNSIKEIIKERIVGWVYGLNILL